MDFVHIWIEGLSVPARSAVIMVIIIAYWISAALFVYSLARLALASTRHLIWQRRSQRGPGNPLFAEVAAEVCRRERAHHLRWLIATYLLAGVLYGATMFLSIPAMTAAGWGYLAVTWLFHQLAVVWPGLAPAIPTWAFSFERFR